MAKYYKTADEEESLSSFFSFCNPIIPAWFHSYNVPFQLMYPFLLLTEQLSFFFKLPNANTLLVYLLFAIKQQFYDHGFNSRTENLKPMDY